MKSVGSCFKAVLRKRIASVLIGGLLLAWSSGVLAKVPVQNDKGKAEVYLSWLNTIKEGKDIPGLTEQEFYAFLNWYISSPQARNLARLGPFASGQSEVPFVCGLCGDVNGSGGISVSDIVMLIDYLYDNLSLTCPTESDVDDYASINIRDLPWLVNFLFDKSRPATGCNGSDPGTCWPLTCPPTNPPLVPVVLPTDTLVIPAALLRDGDSVIALNFRYKNADSLQGFVLPLRFRVAGLVPVLDTVITGPRFSGDVSVDTLTGEMRLLDLSSAGPAFGPGSDTMMTVYLSIAPNALVRTVTAETTDFAPDHHPLFLDVLATDYAPVLPTLCFNPIPGDVNASGGIPNLQDVIYLVNYVFDKDRPATGCLGTDPVNCWTPDPVCRGDVNGSGGNPALPDVIHLVNYVFDKDRSATGCLGIDLGNCWMPMPPEVCCMP